MITAPEFALICSGAFLLVGMLTGIWKYRHMMTSANAEAPYYVNIAHRTSLMYSFATLVLYAMAQHSVWSNTVNFLAVLVSVGFYAAAIGTYVLHGLLRDTDNQLQKPHKLGHAELPSWAIGTFMLGLIVGEVGGAAVLFSGMVLGVIS